MSRPPATLSLDLENFWAHQRTRGDSRWRAFHSFLDVAVPRSLELLDRLGVKATVFVVGRDIELPGVDRLLGEVVAAGHELGNHSFEHDIALHRADPEALRVDVTRAEAAIAAIAGELPLGFRAPAFGLSRRLLELLAQRGYRYDASSLPASTRALARAYHLHRAVLGAEERARQRDVFGGWAEVHRPLRPYRWELEAGTLVELPVTTLPLARLPVHFMYLNLLADGSEALARVYLGGVLRLCRLCAVPPSLLLHAGDFIAADDVACPPFLPGMRRPWARKARFMAGTLQRLVQGFTVHTLGAYAEGLDDEALPAVLPPRV